MAGRNCARGGAGLLSGREGEALLELLSRSMLFEGMEPGEIARLLEGRCELASFAKGELIYSPSRYRNCLGILLAGEAGITKSGQEGRQVAMNLLTPPMAFGAAALFQSGGEYVAEITALAPSRILFLSQERLEEIFRLDYGTARRYIAFLSGRIRFLNRKIDAFTTVGAPQRLAAFLADSAQPAYGRHPQAAAELRAGERASPEPDGSCRGAGACWFFPIPKGVTGLSHTLNMGRASLYRAFDALAAQGLLRREGKVLWISDREALRRAAAIPPEALSEDGGRPGGGADPSP